MAMLSGPAIDPECVFMEGSGLTNDSVSCISSTAAVHHSMDGKKSVKKGKRCLTVRGELR
jgi:hypothetical protein